MDLPYRETISKCFKASKTWRNCS